MLRIMLLADAPWANTGYGKMAANLVRFSRVCGLDHIWGWTCIGGLSGGKIEWGDIQLYPRGQDMWSQDVVMNYYMEHNADVLISMKDVWLFGSLPSMPLDWAPLVPIDHSPISTHITAKLQTAFAPIAISKFGQIELAQHKIHSTYIPHAVDTNLYRPIDEVPKPDLKSRLDLPPGSWVVGLVSMNRSRKCIARQLRGFARFLENNPDAQKDAVMFMWTSVLPEGDSAAVDLRPIIRELGLNNRVYYPGQAMYEKGLPEVKMPHLYNTFDVLTNVSSEGAGLPILEAGSCGIPQLVLRYAAGPEYWTSGAIVNCADIEYWSTPGVPFGLLDIDDYAEKLAKIYNGDPEKYRRRALRAIKPFNWESVVRRFWEPFLGDLESRVRPLVKKDGISAWRSNLVK